MLYFSSDIRFRYSKACENEKHWSRQTGIENMCEPSLLFKITFQQREGLDVCIHIPGVAMNAHGWYSRTLSRSSLRIQRLKPHQKNVGDEVPMMTFQAEGQHKRTVIWLAVAAVDFKHRTKRRRILFPSECKIEEDLEVAGGSGWRSWKHAEWWWERWGMRRWLVRLDEEKWKHLEGWWEWMRNKENNLEVREDEVAQLPEILEVQLYMRWRTNVGLCGCGCKGYLPNNERPRSSECGEDGCTSGRV